MSANRSTLLVKTHRLLKKHYKSVSPNLQLPMLHQLLYACCLEDATADMADRAVAALETHYYDWNEVRVSTATELSESMHMLPDPLTAGTRVKRVLQSVFETNYSFELEQLKKENIGVAVKKLHKLKGVTPFTVSYVTQVSLVGHSIPIGRGGLAALYVIGVVTEKERSARSVPGLERAIPKNKGIEFGSLLNQLGADFLRAPYGPAVRKILLEIAPDAKDRLPKRRSKKDIAAKAAAAGAVKKAAVKKAAVKKALASTTKVGKTTKKAPLGKKKKVVAKSKTKGRVTTKKKVAKKSPKKRVPTKKSTRKAVSSRSSKRKPR